MMLIISGPSGSGKTSLVQRLIQEQGYELVKSYTTRPQRSEEDEKQYVFVTEDVFFEMADRGEFLEFNAYPGSKEKKYYYGTPSEKVFQILENGKTAILEIDVNGKRRIVDKENDFKVYSVFIMASAETISNRLLARKTEKREAVIERLRQSLIEIEEARLYDVVIFNNECVENGAAAIDEFIKDNRKQSCYDINTVIEEYKKEMTTIIEGLEKIED